MANSLNLRPSERRLLVIVGLILFVVVNIWFIWPLIGWGFAVALHGMRVFLLTDRNDLVEALTERELRQSGVGKSEEGQHRKQPK